MTFVFVTFQKSNEWIQARNAPVYGEHNDTVPTPSIVAFVPTGFFFWTTKKKLKKI